MSSAKRIRPATPGGFVRLALEEHRDILPMLLGCKRKGLQQLSAKDLG